MLFELLYYRKYGVIDEVTIKAFSELTTGNIFFFLLYFHVILESDWLRNSRKKLVFPSENREIVLQDNG